MSDQISRFALLCITYPRQFVSVAVDHNILIVFNWAIAENSISSIGKIKFSLVHISPIVPNEHSLKKQIL